MKKVYIIAEAGVNHNGSIDLAKQLIDEAVRAGVDAVKFQTFKTEFLVTRKAEKANYQRQTTGCGSQYEMIKRLELSETDHYALIDHCRAAGIQFCSTAFDLESIDLLKRLNVPFWKIPSGEITNLPYLRKIGSFGGRVILSTGMTDLGEIEDALEILTSAGTPRESITLLHCNTEYPTPMHDVNLLAMLTMKRAFEIEVGYSDHTRGIEVPIAAVALGAAVIEKHFTLDRSMEGPDHKASLEPAELTAMVQAIRNVEEALGDGRKTPSASEMKNRTVARKSIVARQKILKGELFTADNLTVKRPGTGLSPMFYETLLGRISPRDYEEDEIVELY